MNYHELEWAYATTQEPRLVTATDSSGKVYTVPESELPEDITPAPCAIVNPGD